MIGTITFSWFNVGKKGGHSEVEKHFKNKIEIQQMSSIWK
tara:strand:+ start:56 stop:175 length:120 start_codon:yes stop_codon:yes gene_type:complete